MTGEHRKEGKHMTMKEKLKIHREMERRNAERIKAYIARQKKTA